MSRQGEAQLKRAKAYILDHPHDSKAQIAAALGVSDSTIARARRELVLEASIEKSRKSPPRFDPLPPAPPPPPKPAGEPEQPKKPATMLDSDAMRALADITSLIDSDKLDDVEVHKRLLKQCLRFAFDPRLHPDTRMSASQMWSKLRDQAKAKDLGPGVPLNFEDAVARLADMMQACGPKITLAAVNIAFDSKEKPDEAPLETGDTGEAPQAPSSP